MPRFHGDETFCQSWTNRIGKLTDRLRHPAAIIFYRIFPAASS
jgi:hypothetical protein